MLWKNQDIYAGSDITSSVVNEQIKMERQQQIKLSELPSSKIPYTPPLSVEHQTKTIN